MKYKKIKPCGILKKTYDNAYRLEFSKRFDISPKFNVANLHEYHEGGKSADEGTFSEWEQQLPIKLEEQMEEILSTRVDKKTR